MKIFESTFPENFRKEDIEKILGYVTTGKFCQIVCIPGAGKATILRLLAHNRKILKYHLQDKEKALRIVYLNPLELSNFDEVSIYKFILLALEVNIPKSAESGVLSKLLAETVNHLADNGYFVVFLFDHFDECANRFPRSFFQMLKSVNNLAKYKFSAIFATRRDLSYIVDEQIRKDFWGFFLENTVHIKIYDKEAANLVLAQAEKILDKKLTPSQKSQIVKLTGGHAKLTKIIAELALRENIAVTPEHLLQNKSVRATLLELWLFLTAEEQHTLFHLSQDAKSIDPALGFNLMNLDILKINNQQSNNSTIQQYTFTIPLFAEFVKVNIKSASAHKIIFDSATNEIKKGENIISELLSAQESRLLKFLIQNPGRIIERDELIGEVWPHSQVAGAISDEAIDQMIFRLRKKIEDEPANPKHLITIKGQGLRFTP